MVRRSLARISLDSLAEHRFLPRRFKLSEGVDMSIDQTDKIDLATIDKASGITIPKSKVAAIMK